MKSICKKVLVVVMAAIMLMTLLPSSEAMADEVYLIRTGGYYDLVIGGTIMFEVSGTKDTVTWSSSNKKVATVTDTGLVKGIKAGKATITAKVSGKKYTEDVEVKKQLVAELAFKAPKGGKITKKKIDGKTVYIVPYNSTFTLNKTNAEVVEGYIETDLKKYEEKEGSIKGVSVPVHGLKKGTKCTLNKDDVFRYLSVFIYKEDEGEWLGLLDDGKINIKKMPKYDYFTITLTPQRMQNIQNDGIGGQVEYYFRFK